MIILNLGITDLDKHMRNIDKNKIRDYMKQLIAGLEYMHSRKVWHRDIKPSNIIIMDNDRLCYADFGSCKIMSCIGGKSTKDVQTLFWRAPEIIIESEEYDGKIDVFSLGIIYASMHLGKNVFILRDSDEFTLLRRQAKLLGNMTEEQWPSISKYCERLRYFKEYCQKHKEDKWKEKLQSTEITDVEIDIIRKMTIPNPEKRSSINEILKEFNLLESKGETSESDEIEDDSETKVLKMSNENLITISRNKLLQLYDKIVTFYLENDLSLRNFLHAKVIFEKYLSRHSLYPDSISPVNGNVIKIMCISIYLTSKLLDIKIMKHTCFNNYFKNEEEIYILERHVLKVLNFDLVFPTIYSYIEEMTLDNEIRQKAYAISIIYILNSFLNDDKFNDKEIAELSISLLSTISENNEKMKLFRSIIEIDNLNSVKKLKAL